MSRVAECCCGKSSIQVEGEPSILAVCHCNNCKKRTGSAFGISSYFPREQVLAKTEDMSCYEFFHEEHDHYQKRYFCSGCGTTLYWSISTMDHLVGIAGGCFVQTPLGEPSRSINHRNICSWLSIPTGWDTSD